MPKSIFDTNAVDGPLVGPLDTFTGAAGASYSNMPEALIDGKVETDDEDSAAGDGALLNNPDEPVVRIAEALDERRHTEPAPPARRAPDGPG